jgi:diaminopimelate decarboxylase
VDYRANVLALGAELDRMCAVHEVKKPRIFMEPGRSIVAAAGCTLYTCGSVRSIPGFRNYVSVDGGMPDNPRYALYQSRYTILNAARAADPADFPCTVAGRCCESGDLLGENIRMAKPVRGDIIAVLVTGAYNYSMASNYNRIPRPPIVELAGGKAKTAVRRETFADLAALDC